MLYVFAALLFALSMYDAWITQARIKHFGIQVELNRAIQFLASKLGPEFGAMIGVMVPAVGLIGLSLLFHLQWVLAFLTGFRARQFFTQVESRLYEKEIQEFISTFGRDTASLPVAREQSLEPKFTPNTSSEGN